MQINNPNKGMGIVHHGAVSNCTSLYCGGHVASRKESTVNCVKILVLLALPGALIESQISLNRIKCILDRGYGGVEGEVNSFALAKGLINVYSCIQKNRKSAHSHLGAIGCNLVEVDHFSCV